MKLEEESVLKDSIILNYGKERRELIKKAFLTAFSAYTALENSDKLLLASEAILGYGRKLMRTRNIRNYADEHDYPPEIRKIHFGNPPFNEFVEREIIKPISKKKIGTMYEVDFDELKKYKVELGKKKGQNK